MSSQPSSAEPFSCDHLRIRCPCGIRDRPTPARPGRTDISNGSSARTGENDWIMLWSWARPIFTGSSGDGPSLACVGSAVNCQSVSVACLLQSAGDLTPKPTSQSSVLFGCSRELPFALCFDGTNALPVQHEQCFVLVVDELDWAEVGEIEGAVFDEARRIVDHAVGLIAIVAGIRRDATLLDTTAHFHLARQHQVFARAKVFVASKC